MPTIPPPIYPPPPVPSASTLQRREEEEEEPKHHARKCMSCHKEAELVDGLCADCKWKIKNGILPPVKIEKKHFWNRKRSERILNVSLKISSS